MSVNNCRVSLMYLVIIEELSHSCDEVTFRMPLSKKITIIVTESFSSKCPFLPLVLNKNNINEHTEYHGILISFKGKIYSEQGSDISFVWDMDFIISPCRCANRIFSRRGSFVELWHFDKNLVKNTRKRGLQGKIFELIYC